MRINFLLVVLIAGSCNMPKYNTKTKQNIELLKNLSHCKCLEYSINKFVGKDSIDISSEILIDKFYSIGLSRKSYYILDSMAKSVMISETNSQFASPNKYLESYGKVSYKIGCYNFYHSKSLDSLVKILLKKNKD
jgi:hypothetical protein